jgi:CheY-like chemotaxis protein
VAEFDVLMVEDTPEFAQIVTTVVRNAGHRVRAATTIADALTSLASTRPRRSSSTSGCPTATGSTCAG